MANLKQTIAIDLDDVLSPFVPEIMNWYNNKYQSNLQFEQFTSYDFSKIWGGTLEESSIICDAFHESRVIEHIQPIKDSVKVLNQLKNSFELILVTSRPLQHSEYTNAWINHHFPKIFTEVILCNHWTKTGRAIKKSDVCKDIGAKYFIDDLPIYIEEVSNCEIKSFLFGNYPWNQNVISNSYVQRVSGWTEVLTYLGYNSSARCKPGTKAWPYSCYY